MKLVVMFLALVSVANATPINVSGVMIEMGSQFKNGVTYIDSPTTIGEVVRGVGQINEVRNEQGSVIWADGDNGVELNFYYTGLTRVFQQPILNSVVYGDIGGQIHMYTQAVGSFNPTGDWVIDSAAIGLGDMFLSLYGHVNPDTSYTFAGIQNHTTNSGSGLLDIVGGAAAEYFDTNTLFDGSDVSLNYSADNIATAGYTYSGSIDAAVFGIPAPSTLLLGMAGIMTLASRRRK